MSGRAKLPAEGVGNAGTLGQKETEKLIEQAKKLEQLNSWFEVALNNMARGLSMFDAEGRLIVCNAIYREIYELSDELARPGTHIAELVAYHVKKEGGRDTPADRERQRQWINHHLAELARGQTFTHTQRLKNGRIILVTNQPLADGGWVDIQEDVTEKTRAQDRITWLARHDSLTESANRFYFSELLEQAITGLPAGSRIAVHLIDLDRFKPVNDTLGHAAGDALLKAVAKRLRATVRDGDVVGRLGGDEFAIIQSDITGAEQAESLAKRLLKVLNAPYRVLGNVANIGGSIGIVIAPDAGKDPGGLLKRADLALYRVKENGRGAYAFYEPDLEKNAIQREELEADLNGAIGARQLELHYQPIVDLKTRRVTACEALMRWRHPRLGMISPATFIPIAEKSRLMVSMGDWALHQACRDAATWPEDIKVSVNLSAVQFDKGDPYESVADALAKSGLAANRLEVEITETVLMRNEERTQRTLEKLRGLGIKIALDDFGTAFASLSYLRNFTFDRLKIDRSFVREVMERKDCLAIVNAVTGLAKSLNLATVAEGIETAEQLEKVQTAGCNEVQGFYFSRPVPASELHTALAQCHDKRGDDAGQ